MCFHVEHVCVFKLQMQGLKTVIMTTAGYFNLSYFEAGNSFASRRSRYKFSIAFKQR